MANRTLEPPLPFGLMCALTPSYSLRESWFPEVPQMSKWDYWSSTQSPPLSLDMEHLRTFLDLHMQAPQSILSLLTLWQPPCVQTHGESTPAQPIPQAPPGGPPSSLWIFLFSPTYRKNFRVYKTTKIIQNAGEGSPPSGKQRKD